MNVVVYILLEEYIAFYEMAEYSNADHEMGMDSDNLLPISGLPEHYFSHGDG